MELIGRRGRGERRRNPAGRRYAHDSAVAEHNDIIPIPRAAQNKRRSLADGLRKTASHVDFLELASRPERDEPTVRGPERLCESVVSAGQSTWLERIHRTNPQELGASVE